MQLTWLIYIWPRCVKQGYAVTWLRTSCSVPMYSGHHGHNLLTFDNLCMSWTYGRVLPPRYCWMLRVMLVLAGMILMDWSPFLEKYWDRRHSHPVMIRCLGLCGKNTPVGRFCVSESGTSTSISTTKIWNLFSCLFFKTLTWLIFVPIQSMHNTNAGFIQCIYFIYWSDI